MSEKSKRNKRAGKGSRFYIDSAKQRLYGQPSQAPGLICIERHSHGRTVVVSGTLTLEHNAPKLDEWIEQELQNAILAIKELGGSVRHIRVELTVSSKNMITATAEKTHIKEAQFKTAYISLIAIMYKIGSDECVDVVRKALAGVRNRLRETEQ